MIGVVKNFLGVAIDEKGVFPIGIAGEDTKIISTYISTKIA